MSFFCPLYGFRNNKLLFCHFVTDTLMTLSKQFEIYADNRVTCCAYEKNDFSMKFFRSNSSTDEALSRIDRCISLL